MGYITRKCACGKEFQAREADIKRGWAKSCSKSCAATASNAKTGKYRRYLATSRLDQSECDHDEAMASIESGWDGHKEAF